MERSVGGVGVLDKAVGLLDVLADRGALGLGELTAATGMPRATAYRLAVALERHGLVRRDADGRFGLGLKLIGLGRAAGEGLPLRAAARPALEALRDRTGESVQLYVAAGGGRVAVESLESPHGLRWIVPVGAVLPLDRGSAGRVLSAAGDAAASAGESPANRHGPDGAGNAAAGAHAAADSPAAAGAHAAAGAPGDAAAATPTAPAAGRRSSAGESPEIRQRMLWVESVEEREPGVASVSVPVHDRSGRVIAAVSVSGPVERLSRSPGARYGDAVVEAARAIERIIASI